MPTSRNEWIVFSVGASAIAVLVLLIAVEKLVGTSSPHAAAIPVHVKAAVQPPTTAQPQTAVTSARPATSSTAPAPPVAAMARLVLTASRGRTWLAVRRDSRNSTPLFQGILDKGQTKTFSAKRLWVSLGGASNVDARLNGNPLALPSGTIDVAVTSGGLNKPPRAA